MLRIRRYTENTQYYEEISDKDADLNSLAAEKLASLSKITSTLSMAGVNSDGAMGQFFVGDPIYVEEKIRAWSAVSG